MKMQTLGHAIMLLSGADGTPILATDPWVAGSCYWRSWWMVNYPRADEIARIARARFLYLTHEHPDHLHTPSLRKLAELAGDARPEILLPDFLIMKMEAHLVAQGWRVRRLPGFRWVALQPGVNVMSIPTWNNDSLLLVDTPKALIMNFNDAKPPAAQVEAIGRLRQSMGKFSILLRSHSPAGPSNSYFRDGKRIESKIVNRMRAIRNVCRRTGADMFQPFASQVEYRRPDTAWANDYRLGYSHLRENWTEMGGTCLLAPFGTVDLSTRQATCLPADEYDPANDAYTRRTIGEQVAGDERAQWTEDEHRRLEAQLRSIRWPLAYILPRGFSIEAGAARMFWNARAGRLERGRGGGQFTLRLPLLPLKDALRFGHVGDLCIPMFTEIHLDGDTPMRRVDVFFMLLILRDYGYVRGGWRTLRWALWAWKIRRAGRKALPLPG